MKKPGTGFKVQGTGFKVQGTGFKVQGSRFKLAGAGCKEKSYEAGRLGGLNKNCILQALCPAAGGLP